MKKYLNLLFLLFYTFVILFISRKYFSYVKLKKEIKPVYTKDFVNPILPPPPPKIIYRKAPPETMYVVDMIPFPVIDSIYDDTFPIFHYFRKYKNRAEISLFFYSKQDSIYYQKIYKFTGRYSPIFYINYLNGNVYYYQKRYDLYYYPFISFGLIEKNLKIGLEGGIDLFSAFHVNVLSIKPSLYLKYSLENGLKFNSEVRLEFK